MRHTYALSRIILTNAHLIALVFIKSHKVAERAPLGACVCLLKHTHTRTTHTTLAPFCVSVRLCDTCLRFINRMSDCTSLCSSSVKRSFFHLCTIKLPIQATNPIHTALLLHNRQSTNGNLMRRHIVATKQSKLNQLA